MLFPLIMSQKSDDGQNAVDLNGSDSKEVTKKHGNSPDDNQYAVPITQTRAQNMYPQKALMNANELMEGHFHIFMRTSWNPSHG